METNPTGRPRSVDPDGQELASCRVTFLVTPAQRAALFASAKELGVPVGEYVRERLGF